MNDEETADSELESKEDGMGDRITELQQRLGVIKKELDTSRDEMEKASAALQARADALSAGSSS